MTVTLTSVRVTRGAFVLGPVTATIPVGVTGIVGVNGAGKTTLLRTLAGVDRPQSGTIDYGRAGQSFAGYVAQDFSPPRRARVEDFMHLADWSAGGDGSTRAHRVRKALEAIGLEGRSRSRCGALSGGMQRRLGVAAALVSDPPLLVLDEPTVGLDPLQKAAFRDLVRNLGVVRPVVLSSHGGEDISSTCEHLLVLHDGALLFAGPTQEFIDAADPASVGDSGLERALATVTRTDGVT